MTIKDPLYLTHLESLLNEVNTSILDISYLIDQEIAQIGMIVTPELQTGLERREIKRSQLLIQIDNTRKALSLTLGRH